MSQAADTPASRIESLRKSIPPKEGRRSRIGYISKDDFADLIGAGRSTVINWTTGKSYPESGYRLKLAELSQGLYQPDDFAPPPQAQIRDLRARLEELEELAHRVAPELERVGLALEHLTDRVTAAEKRLQPTRRRGSSS